MIHSFKKRKLILSGLLFGLTCLGSAAVFFLCYQHDNKYTAPGPQPINGVLLLSEEALRGTRAIYLVQGWEIYRGKLLTPEDFASAVPPFPDEYTFIGQYGGFEGRMDSSRRSPHGSAAYRLNIFLPPDMRSYTLELPEIYSAYKLYVNGTLVKEMGDASPESYRPETGMSSVTIQASERIELLFVVSDYTHFYSGMVYPPAFGVDDSVAKLMNLRFGLRAAACAVALCVGLLYVLVGALSGATANREKNDLPFLYAALCLCFTAYICYPVVKTLFPGGMGLYAVERFAYCAMLLMVILIQNGICCVSKAWTGVFAVFGSLMCGLALLLSLVMGDNLNMMMIYSFLVGLYALMCALYLTVCAAISVTKGSARNKFMLAGIAAFDAALIMDRLLPQFEPIVLGWFTELAGGALVLCIGIVMAIEVSMEFRLRQAMEARVESVSRMLEVQQAYYPVILEKEEEARAAKHDLRHHVAMIRELAMSNSLEKLLDYLDEYDEKRIPTVQISYCRHYVTDMLLRMYAGLASKQSTDFRAEVDLPERLAADDSDLCVILSNILENALEASARIPPEERQIVVRIGFRLNRLGILVENRFDGSLRVENGRFFSLKRRYREGIGLASVQAVAARYGGSTDFYADGQGRFYSEALLTIRQGEINSGDE